MGALTKEQLDEMRAKLAEAFKAQAGSLIDETVALWEPPSGHTMRLRLELDTAVYREITKPPETDS